MAKKTNKYIVDGQSVPSVTTITGMIAKPQLYYWYGKHGNEKCKEILDASAEFGSKVHSLIEQTTKGQKVTLDNQFKDIIHNFELVTKDWEWLRFEEVLINKEHMYGGTADAVAKIGGKTCLVDFKTSSAVYPEHYIQVAAYEACLPEVEDCYILHLDKDTNGWELLHAKTEGLFDVFLAAKKIYDFIRNK